MGSWGTNIFESDETLDFLDEFTESEDATAALQVVETALATAAAYDEVMKASVGARAIAAGAIVAESRQPGTLAAFGAGETEGPKIAVTDELIQLTLRAVDAAWGPDSEWMDLWIESGNELEYATRIEKIRNALNLKS
ncbi:DUF4259 domain-containing protein [Streptomyces sp. IGB124]|uniref:DUF4259 domain-containing protein n=1 Tax=Streptomyces sp. IGB124 TaxID=1519485 RepID=UPI00099CE303|nr:DUF4259 domain-containing protein [Streptomyces sp. IGB124]